MNENKIDVFIPATKKDFVTLEMSVKSLIKHIPEVNDVVISMPDIGQNAREYNIDGHKVKFFNDFEIVKCNCLNECKFRPNWIYQQLLKLLQRKTSTKNVLIFDADLIVISRFDIFRDGHPMLYWKRSPTMTYTEDWQCFNNFIMKASKGDLEWANATQTYDSFISDTMIFNIDILEEMLARYGYSHESFVDFTIHNTEYHGNHAGSFISEYQMYGLYCQKYHKDEYVLDRLKVTEFNKFQLSQAQQSYTRKEIENQLKLIDPKQFNIVKFQTGCCASDISYKTVI